MDPQALHSNNNNIIHTYRELPLEPSIIIRSDVIIRSLATSRDIVFAAGNKYNRSKTKSSTSKCAIRKWDENGGVHGKLKGHTNGVTALTTWHDGLIASASHDCTIRIWDTAGGLRSVFQENGHNKWVLCLTVWNLSDTSVLVSGSADFSIKLWNQNGECTATFTGHSNTVSALAVCTANNTLWSGSWDRTVRVWDSAGNCIKTLYAHDKPVTALCELGHLMISGGDDNAIVMWHHDSGNPLKILKGHTGSVLALCPFTTLLNRTRVFFSASADQTIRAWDEEGRPLGVLKKHSGSVSALLVWNNKLWSGSWDKSVIGWTGLELMDDQFVDTQSQSLSQFSPGSQSQSSQDLSSKSQSPNSSQDNAYLRGKKRRLCDEQSLELVEDHSIPESPKKPRETNPEKVPDCWKLERDRLLLELAVHKKNAEDAAEKLKNLIQERDRETQLRNTLLHIKFTDITFVDNTILGKGGSSEVRRGKYHGMDVAVKQLVAKDPHYAKQRHREVSILRDCTHQNIVAMIGTCVDPEYPLCVVTEYMEKGSLFDYLHNTPFELATEKKISIANDIAAGLAFLHARNIIHQDIKSSNILLNKSLTAKICDFGFSEIPTILNVSSSSIGPRSATVCYSAPEYVLNQPITTKVDCFSFGILLWELAARQIPFKNSSVNEIANAISHGMRPDISAVQREHPQLTELMKACWAPLPQSRPTMEEVHANLNRIQSESNSYDLFLSHFQLNGGDLVRSIKFELLQKRPYLKTFLDVDDLNQLHNLEDAVSRSKHLLLLLTEGVLERPWVQLEIRTALRHNVDIIPVHDLTRCQFPNVDLIPQIKLINITREELKQALLMKAIPFLRDQPHRDLSIDMILKHMNQ